MEGKMKKLISILIILVMVAINVSIFNNKVIPISSEESRIVYKPQEIQYPLKNPDTGWINYSFSPFTDFTPLYSGSSSKYSTTCYSNYFTWRDLEPQEGVYDFSAINNFVNQWSNHGMSLAIGIHMADATSLPGQIHVPQYIYESVGGKWITSLYGGAFTLPYPTWEPYYWDDLLLDSWGNMLKAFAAEYAKKPKWQKYIKEFDMSSFGQWGEWHTEMFGHESSKTDPKSKLFNKSDSQIKQIQVQTMERMSKQYTDLFLNNNDGIKYPKLGLNVVYSTVTYGEYKFATNGTLAPGIKNVIDNSLFNQISIYRRFIGGEYYLYGPDRTAILKNWQKLRFHGEWGSATGNINDGDFGNNTQGNPTTTQQAIQQALDYHSSTLGWYVGSVLESKKLNVAEVPSGKLYNGKDYIYYDGMTLEEYYQANCGYRLVLNSAEFPSNLNNGQTFKLIQNWAQKGVATVYNKYNLTAYLVNDSGKVISLGSDESFDARGMLKKENDVLKNYNIVTTHKLPANISPGYYQLKIAVTDPATGEPAVNLAILGKDNGGNNYGKYSLGYIEVGNFTGKKPTFTANSYIKPEKMKSSRPILKKSNNSFVWGDPDNSFTGYAGFSFSLKKGVDVYDIGYAIKDRKYSYPVIMSIVDLENKNVLVSQVFRFAGGGYLESGQLSVPVKLFANRKYAVLARYSEEKANIYGEKIVIKTLYRNSPLNLINSNFDDIHAVTSSDGKIIKASEGGENKSNGVINLGFKETSASESVASTNSLSSTTSMSKSADDEQIISSSNSYSYNSSISFASSVGSNSISRNESQIVVSDAKSIENLKNTQKTKFPQSLVIIAVILLTAGITALLYFLVYRNNQNT